jgi:hypothetical protein
MKLKEIFINLVGFFKCSIENNIVLCAGIENILKNDNDEVAAEAFLFDVFDTKTNTIPESIVVVFNQVGDKIIFGYRKDKFEVISISDNLITVRKDGIDYFIERINLPL